MWRRHWVGLARWGGAVRCGAMGGAVGEGGIFFSRKTSGACFLRKVEWSRAYFI